MSICTISVLAPDFLTLPGWLCVTAKSVHLSLPRCAKPAERERRQEHTLEEVPPSEEKWRKWTKRDDSGRKNAKKRRESYLLNNCLFNSFKWLKLSVCLSLWL